MKVPKIETARLRLRGHKLDDFEAVAALWSEPEVVRHISGAPSPREESWARMMRTTGHWALLGYGYWAIEEKATRRFIGEGGFADFRREIEPPIETPEQGWVLATAAHGKGYATEAVGAMLAWAESRFRRRDFTCIISPSNLASIRVAEKNGYRENLRVDYKGDPTIVFRRPR